MQKIFFILVPFILFFICLTACKTDKKQNAAPCVLHDFNMENINSVDSTNACEVNGLCHVQIDSLEFEGKVMSFLLGDTLINFDLVLKGKDYANSTMSFQVDLRTNALVDSSFYLRTNAKGLGLSMTPIYKMAISSSSVSTDCFQYDKQKQVIAGYVARRKFVLATPNPKVVIKDVYISALYFKANTKILKSPCVLCG